MMQDVSGHEKGPRVFLDYDQAELDAAYDQRRYAANAEQILARCAALSAETRDRLGPPVRLAYGAGEEEGLDLYRTERRAAPVVIFVHGGAWRNGAARDCAFPAELFNAAGAHYIALDFILVQQAGGSLLPMAEQVRRAIVWTYRNAAGFGGDPAQLYLVGHSSGAHLAAVAATTDWASWGVPANLLKHTLLISGMYDLKPVRLSARSSYVAFDDAMEAALSPQRHIDRLATPLTIAYGTAETPEFQRQARDFAAAVGAAGKPVELVVGRHCNHFEMLETLGHPYAVAGRAALRMMGRQL